MRCLHPVCFHRLMLLPNSFYAVQPDIQKPGKRGTITAWNLNASRGAFVQWSSKRRSLVSLEILKGFRGEPVELDCALLMNDIEHRWHGRPDLYLDPRSLCFTAECPKG